MIDKILTDVKNRMDKSYNFFVKKINNFNLGKVSPNLLKDIRIQCYNSNLPLYKVCNIVVENYNTLSLTVFDKTLLKSIKKSIFLFDSDLNLVKFNEETYKIYIPPLNQEKRIFYLKKISKELEQTKISVRNIRKYFNNYVKCLLKNKKINQDISFNLLGNIKNITKKLIYKIDNFFKEKKKIILKK